MAYSCRFNTSLSSLLLPCHWDSKPLGFGFSCLFGLAFAWCSQHDTGVSWLVIMKIEDILPNCLTIIISYNSTPYCRFTDDHTFWFEDLETIPEDFTETLLAKHQILQTADIYMNRRNLLLSYLSFVSTKKWSWDTLAQVRQCLQFCSLWRWRKGGTVGATKLERKNTLRRIKIQKL